MKYTALFFFLSYCFINCNQAKQHELKKPFTEITACVFSEISYCTSPQDSLHKYLSDWRIVWEPTAINGNYAFVASDGTSYVVAIRGSLLEFNWDAFDNWINQDMNVVTQKAWNYTDSMTGAKISQGSYIGWQNMNNLKDKLTGKSLWQFLDSATTNNTDILITGHSLGGNLATVYASWLSSKFKSAGHPHNNINVITFAAPAAGNTAFASDFNNKFPNSMRFENNNDIVPKLPVVDKVSALGNLFTAGPAASKINVGYKFFTIKLSSAFKAISIVLSGLEINNGNSVYTQTNNNGNLITVDLSGNNRNNVASDWFSEAGYQHKIEQYAGKMGAPVIISP